MPLAAFECGPSGGKGGSLFVDPIPADGVNVTQILIRHGDYVDAIQLQYSDGTATSQHGGYGGSATTFTLDPGEYISIVYGQCTDYIRSITISTNLRTFPALGGPGGNRAYMYQVPPNAEVIGFTGASGSWVDALGIMGRMRFPI